MLGISLWLHRALILRLSKWSQRQRSSTCGDRNSYCKYQDPIHWWEWQRRFLSHSGRNLRVFSHDNDVKWTKPETNKPGTRITLILWQGLQGWSKINRRSHARAGVVSHRWYRLSWFKWIFDHHWSNQRRDKVQRVRSALTFTGGAA